MSSVFGRLRENSVRARLVRGALGSAGVQAASRVLTLILGVILARSLGPEGYGVYAYAFAIMSLLMIVAEAGVPTLLMREIAAAEGRGAWGLVRGALQRGLQAVTLVSVGIAALGFALLFALKPTITPATFNTLGVMLLLLPVAALSKTVAHAMRGLHKVVASQSLELILWPVLALMLSVALFSFDPTYRTPWIAMSAQFIAVTSTLLLSCALLRRSIPKETLQFPREYETQRWLKSSPQFVMLTAALVINNQVDIVMLAWFSSANDLGVYRVGSQSAILILFGLQAVSAVVAPQISRYHAQSDISGLQILVRRATQATTIAAIIVFCTFYVVGQDLLRTVFGKEYGASFFPMMILATGQLAVAAFGVSGPLLSMCGHEKFLSKAIWLSALGNIGLNACLIPIWNVNGAAIATAITATFWAVYLAWFASKKVGIIVFPVSFESDQK